MRIIPKGPFHDELKKLYEELDAIFQLPASRERNEKLEIITEKIKQCWDKFKA